jgi:hypothetical protein
LSSSRSREALEAHPIEERVVEAMVEKTNVEHDPDAP